MKVLLTGATGFIGSHIGDELRSLGIEIIALKRIQSNLKNTKSFENNATWINADESNWKEIAIELKPDAIIHSAWIGVNSEDRGNIDTQIKNLTLIGDLLEIAKRSYCKKFIALGSQAEYGNISHIANEETPVNPIDAYGIIKVSSSQIIKNFCELNNIKWYWLRLYSFFGEGESNKWLIPSIVEKMKIQNSIDLTLGEQQYAYLYVMDVAKSICQILHAEVDSNVFVISSKHTITIQRLVSDIKNLINPMCKLNFGALPYRENQAMLIQGDSSKFEKIFGNIEKSNFQEKLTEYSKKLKLEA